MELSFGSPSISSSSKSHAPHNISLLRRRHEGELRDVRVLELLDEGHRLRHSLIDGICAARGSPFCKREREKRLNYTTLEAMKMNGIVKYDLDQVFETASGI